MTYAPPLNDQLLVLRDHRNLAALGDLDPELAEGILAEGGRFAASVFAPLNRIGDREGARWTPDGVSLPAGFAQAWRAFVDAGWPAVSGPVEHGGQGLPFVLATALLEQQMSANMAFGLAPMLTAGAVAAIAAHASPALQAQYLPDLVAGRCTGTMNLTEPQAGSDLAPVRTMATPVDDARWAVKGTKIFISWGDHDLTGNIVHLVLARTPDAPAGSRGLSLFLVPKVLPDGRSNDLRCVSIEHKLGIHASPTCTMSFGDNDGCIGWLVGRRHGGLATMFTMMNHARLSVGAQGVAIAERATQDAVAFAQQRVQSPRAGSPDRAPVPIIEHPDVRRMLLRMKAQTQAARALVGHAAAQADLAEAGDCNARDLLDLLTPLAKAHATEIGCEVTGLAIQVHGGMGFIEETGVAQHFRDARIAPIYEGTNGIQAADLVLRKLGLRDGAAFADLIRRMREDSRHAALRTLIETVDMTGRRLLQCEAPDRLAAGSPFLTMLATAVCGWLLERQLPDVAGPGDFRAMKRACIALHLEQIVPQAQGLLAATLAPAEVLCAIDARALAE